MDDIDKMIDTIEYHIENGMMIDIQRDRIDKNIKIPSFPLKLSDNLLLMSNEIDFMHDGYIVLQMKDINDICFIESGSFYGLMHKKEGIRDRANKEIPLKDIENWKVVLEQLINYEKYISVRCESEDNELCYSIGKISKLEEDKVYFNHFDLDGKWTDEPRIIPFDKITRIDIDNNYCNTYSKYLKYPY